MSYTDQDLVDIWASGLTDHRITKVVMRGNHYVIFRIPGHNYQSGQQNIYGPSSHTLIEQGKTFCRSTPIKEWSGRVSKKILAAALEEAEKNYKETENV